MIETKLIRAKDFEDPNKCENPTCPYLRVDNCTVCWRHGANAQIASRNRESSRRFKATLFQAELDRLGDDSRSSIYKLTEEIGILRLTLQQVLTSCKTADDLLTRTGTINQLVLGINKVLTNSHSLDMKMGNLMQREKLEIFVDKLVESVSKHVSDVEACDKVVNDIVAAFESLSEICTGDAA